VRNAPPSPDRPEERTNAQTDTENAGQINRRREGSMVAVVGEKWRGERARKKRCYFMTTEAGMYMKTNRKMTILPRQKATFVHI